MEVFWLSVAGVAIGGLGSLSRRARDAALWAATIAVGVAAMLVVGLLLGSGFWEYAFATVVAAMLVVTVARAWPDRADSEA